MRRLGLRAGVLLAVLALGGCASLSEKQCRSGDWEAIGREDGAEGAPADQLERHRDACERHGIAPQEPAWQAGYAQGLEQFCTPKGGYVAGREGRGYTKVCDGKPGEDKFRQAHRHGQEVHALRRIVNEMRQNLRDFEMAALSGDYSDYEVTQLRLRVAQLETELRTREWELERLDAAYSEQHGAPRLQAADRK